MLVLDGPFMHERRGIPPALELRSWVLSQAQRVAVEADLGVEPDLGEVMRSVRSPMAMARGGLLVTAAFGAKRAAPQALTTAGARMPSGDMTT